MSVEGQTGGAGPKPQGKGIRKKRRTNKKSIRAMPHSLPNLAKALAGLMKASAEVMSATMSGTGHAHEKNQLGPMDEDHRPIGVALSNCAKVARILTKYQDPPEPVMDMKKAIDKKINDSRKNLSWKTVAEIGGMLKLLMDTVNLETNVAFKKGPRESNERGKLADQSIKFVKKVIEAAMDGYELTERMPPNGNFRRMLATLIVSGKTRNNKDIRPPTSRYIGVVWKKGLKSKDGVEITYNDIEQKMAGYGYEPLPFDQSVLGDEHGAFIDYHRFKKAARAGKKAKMEMLYAFKLKGIDPTASGLIKNKKERPDPGPFL